MKLLVSLGTMVISKEGKIDRDGDIFDAYASVFESDGFLPI